MRIKLLRRKKMKELYIRQEIFTLGEKLTVKDDQQKNIYYIEGSFFQIPKTFSIMNENRGEVALFTKKVFSFLPKFAAYIIIFRSGGDFLWYFVAHGALSSQQSRFLFSSLPPRCPHTPCRPWMPFRKPSFPTRKSRPSGMPYRQPRKK